MTLHPTPRGRVLFPPFPLQKPELQEQREKPYIYLLPYLLLNREHTDTNTHLWPRARSKFPRGDFLQHGWRRFFFLFPRRGLAADLRRNPRPSPTPRRRRTRARADASAASEIRRRRPRAVRGRTERLSASRATRLERLAEAARVSTPSRRAIREATTRRGASGTARRPRTRPSTSKGRSTIL